MFEKLGIFVIIEEGKGFFIMEGYYFFLVIFIEDEVNVLIIMELFVSKNKD